MLNAGYPLSEVTAALCARWLAHDQQLRLIPMTNDQVETHVTIADPEAPDGYRLCIFRSTGSGCTHEPEALPSPWSGWRLHDRRLA